MKDRHICIICDSFYPSQNSAAVQLHDLCKELIRREYIVTVLVPGENQRSAYVVEHLDRIRVVRLRSLKIRNVGYVRRLLGELFMPGFMALNFRRSPFWKIQFDGIIWYSPSIFHGLFVWILKRKCNVKTYLIIRDIFPEWALDMGLLRRGLLYFLLRGVAEFQYNVADIIGIQSAGNFKYFKRHLEVRDKTVEVLENWLGPACELPCSINLRDTPFSGRKVFIYSGNIGVAQNVSIVIELATVLRHRLDLGFLLVGRGSELDKLKMRSSALGLTNVLFYDEILSGELPGLYDQCVAGLVLLSTEHQSHNIPGKFISYLQNGLPVLAFVNNGNDIQQVIEDESIGKVVVDGRLEKLTEALLELIASFEEDPEISHRCKDVFRRRYTVGAVTTKLEKALFSE